MKERMEKGEKEPQNFLINRAKHTLIVFSIDYSACSIFPLRKLSIIITYDSIRIVNVPFLDIYEK